MSVQRAALPGRPRVGALVRQGATASLVAAALFCASALPANADTHISYRADAGLASDDNLNRSFDYTHKNQSDQSVFADLNASLALPLSERIRLVLGGVVGAERFFEFDGLSHASIGGSATLQFRPSGTYGAPTWSVFARTAADYYESDLRDGYRHSFGLSVRKPITDAIEGSLAVQYNIRDGKSAVFDNHEWAGKVNLDYAVYHRNTLYVGGELRHGDVVSSGPLSFGVLGLARALVFDDAFREQGFVAYKVKADTVIATVGFNMPIGQRYSVDLSYRYVRSTPTERSSAIAVDNPRYTANLLSLAFLVRF